MNGWLKQFTYQNNTANLKKKFDTNNDPVLSYKNGLCKERVVL